MSIKLYILLSIFGTYFHLFHAMNCLKPQEIINNDTKEPTEQYREGMWQVSAQSDQI